MFENPLAQALGIFAFVVSALSVWQRNENSLRVYMATSALLWAVHHFAMASYTATIMFIVIAFRCYLSALLLQQPFSVRLVVAFIFFGFNALGAYVTWDGYITIFAFAAANTATIAVLLTVGLWTRLLLITVELLWLVYNVNIGSVGGVLACLTDGGILIYVLFSEFVIKKRKTLSKAC